MDYLNKLRNLFETTPFGARVLDVATDNPIYRSYVYYLFNKKLKRIVSTRTYNFAIETSSFCNANCTFCPNSKIKRQKNNMSMEIFNKMIERIKEEKITPHQFNLAGTGEPLIDKNIFEKVRLLRKNFPKTILFFPTNLGLATAEIRKKMVESELDNISVSLNANTAEDYKKIMRLDFETTINNLEALIELRNNTKSKLKINLKVAANPINQDSIKDFIKRWENKVDSIGISWIHSWAGAVSNGAKPKRIVRYPCRVLFEQIVIQSNGNVPLCCVDYEGFVVGGNVMTHKILDAYNGPDIKKIKDMHISGQIDKIKMCSHCRMSERGLNWLVP